MNKFSYIINIKNRYKMHELKCFIIIGLGATIIWSHLLYGTFLISVWALKYCKGAKYEHFSNNKGIKYEIFC